MKSQPIIERESDAIFPSTTRRKYSSTLEKLRLAQASVPASPSFDTNTFNRPRSPSRPRLIRSKSSSYLKPCARRAKKGCLSGNDHLSTADARWYLSLPQKVQRGRFTEDEQLILAGHCQSFVFSPPPNILPRRLSNQSVPSLRPSTASTLSSESSEPSLYFDAIQEPADSSIDMDDSMMDELRWMDDQDIDLRLDDYHIHVIQASSPRKSWSSHRRPSFRRDPTSPIPPSSSGTATASQAQPSSRLVTPNEEKFPASHPLSPVAHHRRETQNFLPIHQNRTSIDSATTRHYQDLEARSQVRLWLASPSNFDEAIEFGFLPLEYHKEEPPLPMQDRPSLSTHRFKTAPASSQTFFDDSSPSVFNAFDCPEDDEDSSTSLPDLDMPGTPSDAAFANTHRLPPTTSSSTTNTSKPAFSKPPSLDCPSELQVSLKPKLRYLAPPEGGDRHMTLRMTLTRPDLRDKEDVGTWGLERDPLALEDLPAGRNGRTLWDEPPKQGGIVRKFWRKVSGKEF